MIRLATPADASAIATLFHDTVKRVNGHDYSPTQIAAWAGAAPDPEKWRDRQISRMMLVAEADGMVRGFAELEGSGHIDALYVHADYQGEGIASALLSRIEQEAQRLGIGTLFTEASITAQPFFATHGFKTIQAQWVEYQGCLFKNFKMTK